MRGAADLSAAPGARASAFRPRSRDMPTSASGPAALMSFARHLDLVLLAISLPVFLVAGFPMAGWGAGAGAWLLQQGLQVYLLRRARASDDPRTTVGLMAGSMIGRGWLVAIIIFLVGLTNSHAGLAAAVLTVALFTLYLTTSLILGPLEEPRRPPSRRPPASSGAPLRPDGGAR
jgi:hypothetical protein